MGKTHFWPTLRMGSCPHSHHLIHFWNVIVSSLSKEAIDVINSECSSPSKSTTRTHLYGEATDLAAVLIRIRNILTSVADNYRDKGGENAWGFWGWGRRHLRDLKGRTSFTSRLRQICSLPRLSQFPRHHRRRQDQRQRQLHGPETLAAILLKWPTLLLRASTASRSKGSSTRTPVLKSPRPRFVSARTKTSAGQWDDEIAVKIALFAASMDATMSVLIQTASSQTKVNTFFIVYSGKLQLSECLLSKKELCVIHERCLSLWALSPANFWVSE